MTRPEARPLLSILAERAGGLSQSERELLARVYGLEATRESLPEHLRALFDGAEKEAARRQAETRYSVLHKERLARYRRAYYLAHKKEINAKRRATRLVAKLMRSEPGRGERRERERERLYEQGEPGKAARRAARERYERSERGKAARRAANKRAYERRKSSRLLRVAESEHVTDNTR